MNNQLTKLKWNDLYNLMNIWVQIINNWKGKEFSDHEILLIDSNSISKSLDEIICLIKKEEWKLDDENSNNIMRLGFDECNANSRRWKMTGDFGRMEIWESLEAAYLAVEIFNKFWIVGTIEEHSFIFSEEIAYTSYDEDCEIPKFSDCKEIKNVCEKIISLTNNILSIYK